MLDEQEDALLGQALAIISEHFPQYAVAVISDEGGTLHYDYSNWRIGRMLFRDSLEDMESETGVDEVIDWDDDEEYSDSEGYDDE